MQVVSMYSPSKSSENTSSLESENAEVVDSIDEQIGLGDFDECKVVDKLLESTIEFVETGKSNHSASDDGMNFTISALDQKLMKVEDKLFKSPTFLEDKKEKSQHERMKRENERILQKALEEEIKAKEAESKASAFQFDFGYLDAEVCQLIKQLDEVYHDVIPMPNTPVTKSLYTTTKANVERLGLKTVLNRLCIIGKYESTRISQSADDEMPNDPTFAARKYFREELKRIRQRTNSVFAKELGEITGCLLSYPNYFVLMMEGPEISILDIMHQGLTLFKNYVTEGGVLFVAGHILVRYLTEWNEVEVLPPESKVTYSYDSDFDTAKDTLVGLSETCHKLWIKVAAANEKKLSVNDYLGNDVLPDQMCLQYAMSCGLIRQLNHWLMQLVRLTFGDFTSESWPQIWYPVPFTAYRTDSQFDSLGVLETFDEIPGLDDVLEDFLRNKKYWQPNKETVEDLGSVSHILKDNVVKAPSKTTKLSSEVSRDTENNGA